MLHAFLTMLLIGAQPGKPGPPAQAPGNPAPIDLVWMAGPVANARPTGAQPANTAALRAEGERIYQSTCSVCHGTRGDGRGPQAERLSVPPADFTRGIFKVRSTPTGTLPVDADLYETISRGMHGTEMFPWAALPSQQRWALVYRLKAFSRRFRFEQPGIPVIVGDPPAGAEIQHQQLEARGARLFDLLRCSACHGTRGGADGPAAAAYARESPTDRVRIRNFMRGRFLRGTEPADIFLTLKTGMDGTPMGSYAGLADDDLWALAAHVRTLVREHPLPALPPAPDLTHAPAAP